MNHRGSCLFLATILGLFASVASAQQAGRVAVVEGTFEAFRSQQWSSITFGEPLQSGDRLRTGSAGRARLVLSDGSVIAVGSDTQLWIDEVDSESSGIHQTLLRLITGQVRTLVDPAYGSRGGYFAVETVTAVAAAHGTEFVVTYNPLMEQTDVLGVSGTVQVNSVLDRVNRGVLLTVADLTTIPRGQFPSAPTRLPDIQFRQYLEGLEFVGNGRPESMTVGLPIFSGATVPPPDQLNTVSGTAGGPEFDLDPHDGSSAGESGEPPGSVAAPGNIGVEF